MSETDTRTSTARVPPAELGEDVREQVLTRDGTGGQEQFPPRPHSASPVTAAHASAVRSRIRRAYRWSRCPASVSVTRPASRRKSGVRSSGFELLDALADGGLGEAEVAGGGREAAPLGRLDEGLQVR